MALIKIDLTEQLGEGQYVEIRDPRLLPWGEQKKINLTLTDQSIEAQQAFAEKLSLTLIKNGNINDEDGNAVAFPLTAETIAVLPALILDAVAVEFTKSRKKGEDLPKK